MSKRARHQPGFYATLLNNVCDRASNSKYRPKVKPTVMGVSEVERVVAKRVKGRNIEYFIHQQNYSPSENTWEPAEHLPEDLIAAFENRSVDPLRADECRERLSLLFDSVNLLTLRNYSKNVEDIVSFGFLFLCDNTKSFVLICFDFSDSQACITSYYDVAIFIFGICPVRFNIFSRGVFSFPFMGYRRIGDLFLPK